jgi:hypothetical protein
LNVRRFASAALIAALALCSCRPAAPVVAHPALFVVRDADTTIWLFGTIHALPANVDWRDAMVERAIRSADELVTEIPDADLRDGGATFAAMARRAAPSPPLLRVEPVRRIPLSNAIARAGMTLEQAGKLKTWALALTLASASARAADADRDSGLETVLGARFRAAHKPQAALESTRGQLALFDGLDEADQRALLTATLDDLADARHGYKATLDAWAKGDISSLADQLSPTFGNHPALAETLVTGRNRRWSRWIAARMTRPGKVLVAVGAGHLAGPQSVLAMLEARGLVVQRVQ